MGSNQHGFKRKCSASTLSLQLKFQIERALGDKEYDTLTSLDLSSAFELVKINLFIKIKTHRTAGRCCEIIEVIQFSLTYYWDQFWDLCSRKFLCRHSLTLSHFLHMCMTLTSQDGTSQLSYLSQTWKNLRRQLQNSLETHTLK
jgi:hypothetical protein